MFRSALNILLVLRDQSSQPLWGLLTFKLLYSLWKKKQLAARLIEIFIYPCCKWFPLKIGEFILSVASRSTIWVYINESENRNFWNIVKMDKRWIELSDVANWNEKKYLIDLLTFIDERKKREIGKKKSKIKTIAPTTARKSSRKRETRGGKPHSKGSWKTKKGKSGKRRIRSPTVKRSSLTPSSADWNRQNGR